MQQFRYRCFIIDDAGKIAGSSPSVSQTPFPRNGVCGEANHAEHAVARQIIQELPILASTIRVNEVRFIDNDAADIAKRRCAFLAILPMVATITSASGCLR